MGDSITQGDTTFNSYRRPLWHRLQAAGASVDFIGTLTSNFQGPPPNPDFDLHHEGHRAWRADEIRNSLPGWLTTYTPDVVLVHLGTNDALQNHGGANFLAETIADLEGIIRTLQSDNPNVTVLLAKLIPTTEIVENNRITSLNAQIDGIASRTTTLDSRVVVVDQSSGFSLATDTNDGLHPNSSGETKMANKWFDALNTQGLVNSGSPQAFANGSFESGYSTWNVSGNQGVTTSGSFYTSVEGSRLVVFNWGQSAPNGVLSQTFTTTAGQAYSLTFHVGTLAYNQNEQRLQVTVQGNGALLSQTISLLGAGNGTTQWQPQAFNFTANSSTTTLTFRDVSPTTLNLDLVLDNVRVQPGQATPPPPPPDDPPPPPSGEAPTNLSFESGYLGWTPTGNQGIGTSGSPYRAQDGLKLVVFNWGQTVPNGTLAQSFATVAGQTYRLDFSAGIISYNGSEQRLQVTVTGNGTLLSQTISLFGNGSGDSQWLPQSFVFTANSPTTTLTFRDVSPATHNVDLLLDAVSLAQQSFPPTPGAAVNLGFESDYAGWTSTGNQGIGASGSFYTATEGVKLVVFNWGQTTPNGALSQSFATVAGQAYTLAFDAGVLAFNQNEQRLHVGVQGSGPLLSQTISIFGTGNGSVRWLPQSYVFTANSGRTTLTFRDVSTTSHNLDLLLDNVRITPGSSAGLAEWRSSPENGARLGLSTGAADGDWALRLEPLNQGLFRVDFSEDLQAWREVKIFFCDGKAVEEIRVPSSPGATGFYRVVALEPGSPAAGAR